jgi:hypothetical protein
VQHNGKLSEPIAMRSGVKQGRLLSLISFLRTLDIMMTNAIDRKKGIQRGLHIRLEDVGFTDDLYIRRRVLKAWEHS